MPININPNPEQSDLTINIGSDQGFNINSATSATLKAAKATFGLGQITGKSYDDFHSDIASGNELPMRQQAASQVDTDKIKRKQTLITQAASMNNKTMLQTAVETPLFQTDPSSVVEEAHAGKYIEPVLSDDEVRKNVEDAYSAINAGTNNLAYKNYALTRLRKSIDTYKSQSWTGYLEDLAKDITTQTYSELKLRGSLSNWGHLLGTELEDERQKYYSMPFDQFKQQFDQRMDQLDQDNPSMAIAFGSAVVGQSAQEVNTNDATTVLGLASDIGLGVGGLSKAAKIRSAVQSVVKSDNLVSGYSSRLNKIDQETAKTTDVHDIQAAQAAGNGQMSKAAEGQVSQELIRRFEQKPDPENQAVKSFPGILREDNADIQKDTGNLGTDVANRIREKNIARQIDFTKGMGDLLKVNRTPSVDVAGQEFAHELAEWVKDKYSGANSTVLDGSGGTILYDPVSNTNHVNINIGDHNGEMFRDEAAAVTHAEDYGIPLEQPETSTRRYWDDEATAAAFQVDYLKKEIAKFDRRYTKQQFKPMKYYDLKGQLKDQNIRKRNAWAQRAGAYWKPDQPIEKKMGKITLEKQGQGWFIQGWVPLDETQPFVRNALLKYPGAFSGPASKGVRKGTLVPYLEDFVTGTPSTKAASSVKVFIDTFAGERVEPLMGLRTPDETLSPEENIQRKVATHVPSKLAHDLFKEDTDLIQAVPRNSVQPLRRLLVMNQNMPDPVTGEHGYFFRTLSEFEHHYNQLTGTFPDEKTAQAYFAYTRIHETDRGLRTIAMLRNKWRSGVESHQIEVGQDRKKSPWFDGVIRKELPTAFERSPVYISIGGSEAIKMSGGYTKALDEAVKKGEVSVIELWNREDRPFHKVSSVIPKDTEPRYVVTDRVQTRQLDPNDQVPRRRGGHWVFPYDHYIRKANTYFDPVTKQWIYKGDVTVMPFKNVALGRKIAQKLNEVQNLLREGLIDDAHDFIKYQGISGLDFEKVRSWWHGHTDEAGVQQPPRFSNMHEPFELVPVDKTIANINNNLFHRYDHTTAEGREHLTRIGHPNYKEGLLDTTRYGNMARNNTVEFTGERDAWDMHTVDDTGTANNPVLSYRPAELADPIDVVNRSVTRIANSLWLEDYKFHAAEHWYESFKPWLDTTKGGSPFYHFINPIFKTGMPAELKSMAMSNRKKAMDFVRMPSPLANKIHQVMSNMAGAIYNKSGPQAYNMFAPLVEVPLEKNPVRALRSLTADLKIGLYSIPAFAMQLSAYANLIGFEPARVSAATRAMMLDQYARWMPQHIDYLDKIASRNLRGMTGQSYFRPGHFKYLWDGLNTKTDFQNVGKEHAFQDFSLSDRYMRNWYDVTKYWGSIFFREAARTVRVAGWYASGLKWIEEHEGQLPTTRDHWAQIQDYATLLDHNMSRASNSALNTGPMSIPGQFYTYDRNIAEDMWGKRITWKQKLGLFVASGLMWGFPFGSIGLFGLPFGIMTNKIAQNNGYTVGNSLLTSIFMEGVPAATVAHFLGGTDNRNNWYDFSKFGVKGWGMLTNLLSDDPRWWDALGAMPSTVINTALRLQPLWQDLAGLLHGINTSDPLNISGIGSVPGGGGDWSRFQPTLEDVADGLKEWNGFSQAHKVYEAVRTGVWLSNNNTPLVSNVTAGRAIFQGLTGLVPSKVSGIGTDFSVLADRKAREGWIVNQGTRNWNLALLALKKDPNTPIEKNTEYQTYKRKLALVLDYAPAEDQGKILQQIYLRGDRDLVDSLEQQLGEGRMHTVTDELRYQSQLQHEGNK